MNQLKKTLTAATLGALALMGAASAMADTIDFESQSPTVYGGTETFTEGGYSFLVIDSTASETGMGFAGAIGQGSNPYQCDIAACPTGNSSNYYIGTNDGSLQIARSDGKAFRLSSLDYAFLPPIDNLGSYSFGQLTITGNTVNGPVSASFDFPTLIGGQSPFLTASLQSQFGNTLFSSVTIGSCVFTDALSCVSPAGNQAQFAIDNLVLAAVPEPETYAMLGLGLAAIGLVARRRARAANTNNV
ncbi:NF038120 family PEP-CTERM protein [Duganella callida]|uniref:PEP-CTERM sorting domain-containing protein n=1 Tax=Duganella callida TaxID=2561932 RepID=A0A4Y9STK3_9BURK|nr:NF038120 family PEP-CTERM protein [Duganella callida]TFW29941.1 PEP-CTERM sorting domain-containing protein [Duganella callida]